MTMVGDPVPTHVMKRLWPLASNVPEIAPPVLPDAVGAAVGDVVAAGVVAVAPPLAVVDGDATAQPLSARSQPTAAIAPAKRREVIRSDGKGGHHTPHLAGRR